MTAREWCISAGKPESKAHSKFRYPMVQDLLTLDPAVDVLVHLAHTRFSLADLPSQFQTKQAKSPPSIGGKTVTLSLFLDIPTINHKGKCNIRNSFQASMNGSLIVTI